jgi:hypothetical protein
MTAQLRSELLKLRTTRTTLGLLLGAVAIVLLEVFGDVFSDNLQTISTQNQQRVVFGAGTLGALFAAYTGMILVTNEFRYGTIRPTLLFEPRRGIVIAAKLLAVALVGAVFGVVGVALSFAAGFVALDARGVDFVVSGGHMALAAGGTIAGCVLCAMVGGAIGALIRHQVGAIVFLAVWFLTFEQILFNDAPSVGRYLPGKATSALGGVTTPHLLSPTVGGVALVVWTIAFVALGMARTERGDIA